MHEDKEFRIRARSLQIEEEDVKTLYNKRMNDIFKKWLRLRSECPHLETTCFPDASGNNDYETICNICGASI